MSSPIIEAESGKGTCSVVGGVWAWGGQQQVYLKSKPSQSSHEDTDWRGWKDSSHQPLRDWKQTHRRADSEGQEVEAGSRWVSDSKKVGPEPETDWQLLGWQAASRFRLNTAGKARGLQVQRKQDFYGKLKYYTHTHPV